MTGKMRQLAQPPAQETVELTQRLLAPNVRAQFDSSVTELQLLGPEPAESERLRAAIVDGALQDAESTEALRLAVNIFTGALRDAGTTPERVLVVLKTIIHRESFLALATEPWDRRGKLREQISTWCIEEYFREKTA